MTQNRCSVLYIYYPNLAPKNMYYSPIISFIQGYCLPWFFKRQRFFVVSSLITLFCKLSSVVLCVIENNSRCTTNIHLWFCQFRVSAWHHFPTSQYSFIFSWNSLFLFYKIIVKINLTNSKNVCRKWMNSWFWDNIPTSWSFFCHLT